MTSMMFLEISLSSSIFFSAHRVGTRVTLQTAVGIKMLHIKQVI